MKNNPDYKWKGMVYGLVVLAILTPLMPPPISRGNLLCRGWGPAAAGDPTVRDCILDLWPGDASRHYAPVEIQGTGCWVVPGANSQTLIHTHLEKR